MSTAKKPLTFDMNRSPRSSAELPEAESHQLKQVGARVTAEKYRQLKASCAARGEGSDFGRAGDSGISRQSPGLTLPPVHSFAKYSGVVREGLAHLAFKTTKRRRQAAQFSACLITHNSSCGNEPQRSISASLAACSPGVTWTHAT